MTINKLKANSDKTEFTILASKCSKGLIENIPLNITIDGVEIKPTNKVKNLGVIFDETLSFTNHVNNICHSANYHLYCIGKIRHLLDEKACKAAIISLVISRLDYANSLLYGSNDVLLKRLQRIQNNAARLITKTKKFNHVTPLLMELHWLPIHVRIEYKLLLIVYKCMNGLAPNYMASLLKKYVPTRSLRSSNDTTLLIQYRPKRTSFGGRAFKFSAPHLWNTLPAPLREINSLSNFKTSLKTYLFRKTYC
jgi:hypothetical protein